MADFRSVVAEALDAAVANYSYGLREAFNDWALGTGAKFESPLEAKFAVWWIFIETQAPDRLEWMFQLHPQEEVSVDGRNYRLDFFIEWTPPDAVLDKSYALGYSCPSLAVAIELDGHEFHERTPAQVTLRNQRDRDLQSKGWTICHFSGSEFNRNPLGCVDEAYKTAVRTAKRIVAEYQALGGPDENPDSQA